MNNIRFPNTFQIIIAAVLVLAFLGALGFAWPRYQELSLLKTNLETKQERVQIEKEYFSIVSQLAVQLEENSDSLAKIEAALPDTPSLPSLFNFVQRASSQAGLILKAISPFSLSALEASLLKETKISFELKGSYSSLKSFISSLENSARLVEMENIAFSYPKEGKPFTFNLRIKVFSY